MKNNIGLLIFTAIAIAAFVWMAKRPAVEGGNALQFGIPSASAPAATTEKKEEATEEAEKPAEPAATEEKSEATEPEAAPVSAEEPKKDAGEAPKADTTTTN